MKGDRERCLEAGMDGYVSKPLHPQDLFDALALLSGEPANTPPAAPPTQAIQIPREEVMSRRQTTRSCCERLVNLFIESHPGQMAALRESIARGDAALVRRQAHTLKGAVAIFGVTPVIEATSQLERMGAMNDLTGIDEAWHRLDAAARHAGGPLWNWSKSKPCPSRMLELTTSRRQEIIIST